MCFFRLCFILCCLLTHTIGYSEGLNSKESALFLKAEHAIRVDDPRTTHKLLFELKNTPLYGYLEYQKIKKEITHNQSKKSVFYDHPINLSHIVNYQNTYHDSPLAPKLYYIWLESQASQKKWHSVLSVLKALDPKDTLAHSTALQCHKVHAQYHANPNTETLKPALSLWMSTQDAPLACTPVFDLLYEHDLIDQNKLIEKHQSLLEKKTASALSLAKKLRTQMDAEHQAIANLSAAWIKNPAQVADHALVNQLTKYRNKIIVSSFKQYARMSPTAASHLFEENEASLKLNAFEKGEIIKQIGLSLALQHNQKAALWLAQIPVQNLDNKAREWQIRNAIQRHAWKEVLAFIQKLEPLGSGQAAWQYWKARSLENLALPGYKKIYEALARERSYYGFLAAGYLNQTIQLNHRPHPHSVEDMKNLEKRPPIQRMKALLDLNRQSDANREWHHMIASMSTVEKSHAGRLANKLQWHALALYAFNKSDYKDDVIVRFPLAFEKSVRTHAEDHEMDPAWLWAISRQESNFNPLALSCVGAVGLMQLMPKTAASVGHQSSFNLHNPHHNIELGTRYLKSLYVQTQNPILATAAYNAGPSRIKRWLPKETCAGDIWIESIPYEETRNYVKNVLASIAIYKSLQNDPFLLSKAMPMVQASSN